MNNTQKLCHYAIIGGGISGLALGWFLKKRLGPQLQLTIFEKEARPGGWIQTGHDNGFLFEQGPRSLRPKGKGLDTLALIEELGLGDQLIFATANAYRRYIYFDKKLQSIPYGLLSLFQPPFRQIFLKALWTDWKAPSLNSEREESIRDFVCRRLGPQAADLLFDPLVSGIYAGDINKLSMQACFPLLVDWERSHHALWRAVLFGKRAKPLPLTTFVKDSSQKGIFTLKNGLSTLIDTLASHLKQELKLETCVKSIDATLSKIAIKMLDGSIVYTDRLFTALPPASLAILLQHHHHEIACTLSKIPAASLAIVNIGYHTEKLLKNGFGYLIPSKENENLLGMVWDSSAFPQQNFSKTQTRLTAMIGGSNFCNFDEHGPQEFTDIALSALQRHLNVTTKPDFTAVKIARKAIPQYIVGHGDIVKDIENKLAKLPGQISLLGNAYYGISVNDCIHQAKMIAQQT